MSISMDFGAIRSCNLCRNPKSLKKIHKTPILAFKVIQDHWIRRQSRASVQLPIRLEINSNLGPISHCYWDTATYWLKIANFFHPSHLRPRSGDPFRIYRKALWVPKTTVFQAADGEDLVITVSDWSTRVTDRRTDRIAIANTRWSSSCFRA